MFEKLDPLAIAAFTRLDIAWPEGIEHSHAVLGDNSLTGTRGKGDAVDLTRAMAHEEARSVFGIGEWLNDLVEGLTAEQLVRLLSIDEDRRLGNRDPLRDELLACLKYWSPFFAGLDLIRGPGRGRRQIVDGWTDVAFTAPPPFMSRP